MASDIARILEMVNGYQETCIVVAALQLGVLDKLAAKPSTAEALATEVGADPVALGRLLRALRVLHLVDGADEVSVTPTGKLLLEKGFGAGIRAWALLVGGEYLAAWGQLAHSVKTGDVAFDKVFGMSAWEHRAQHPDLNASFNRVTTGEQLRAIEGVLRAYDFTGRGCIVDVGGGHGNLVAGILKKYPAARGIVFDQPHVVEGAPAALESAGVAARCEVVGGSFLESVPAGGDTYVLKHVLHNWSDADCVTILRHCQAAMPTDGRLLVLENVIPDDPTTARALVMLDLHMMAVLGGRERTRGEYAALLRDAGLQFSKLIPTREGAPDVIEATR
ncbi:MAG TPA: methyltransferase [Kofleriaceae bacterium]